MIDQVLEEPSSASGSSLCGDDDSMDTALCALLEAAAAGDTASAMYAINDLGADINGRDQDGMTALHHAAKSASTTLAEALLAWAGQHGRGAATPEALAMAAAPLQHGATPLHFAAQHSPEVLQLLLMSSSGRAQGALGGKLLVRVQPPHPHTHRCAPHRTCINMWQRTHRFYSAKYLNACQL